MNKVVITLNEMDLIEINAILLDKDKTAALEFIQQTIAPKIPSKGSDKCDSSRNNPYLSGSDL